MFSLKGELEPFWGAHPIWRRDYFEFWQGLNFPQVRYKPILACIHCTGRSLTCFPQSEEKSVYCWSIQGWRGRPQSRLSILDAWLRAIVWKGEYFLQLWLPMYFCATTRVFVFPLFKLNILLASGKCGKRSKRNMSNWVYPLSTPKTPFSNCKM